MRTYAVLVLSAAIVVGSAGAAQANADFTVTATTSETTTSVGSSFVLSGKVSPSADGHTVTIQREYVGGSWTSIDTDKLSSSSAYSVRIHPTKGGPTSYRVVKGSSSSRDAGVSPTRKINVYRWRYLTSLPRNTQGDVALGDWKMKGSTFVKSISIWGNPPVWDIATPQCTRFRSFVGVDDDSPEDTTADTQVILDFATDTQVTIAKVKDLAWGKYPNYIQEDFPAGHSEIIFVGGPLTASSQTGYLTYGTPQVYCNS